MLLAQIFLASNENNVRSELGANVHPNIIIVTQDCLHAHDGTRSGSWSRQDLIFSVNEHLILLFSRA